MKNLSRSNRPMPLFLHLSTPLLKSRRWIITFNYEIDYADTHDIAIIDNPDLRFLFSSEPFWLSVLVKSRLLDRSISSIILIITIVQIFKNTFKNTMEIVGRKCNFIYLKSVSLHFIPIENTFHV